jgi:hypothetical protein
VIALPDQLLTRTKSASSQRVWTTADFLDLGSRAAVDQALSRLVRRGALTRPARGLYAVHRKSERLGIELPAKLEEVVDALARRSGATVVPSGATFANQLGLSTQVPMRAIFQTTGRARRYQIGGTNVELRHVSPRRLKASSPRNLAVLSAIAHLGKANIDETTLARLRSVTERADDASLLDDARNQPAWVVAVVRQVMARTTAAAAPDAGVTTPPSRRRMRGG